MTDIKKIYNDLVISHYKNPYHKNMVIKATHSVHSKNENCGDEITLKFVWNDKKECIEQASFTSKGCIICQSSTSILTKYIEGKSLAEIERAIEKLNYLLEKNNNSKVQGSGQIKEGAQYEALSYVKEFPTRKQCVLLSWNALKKVLQEIN